MYNKNPRQILKILSFTEKLDLGRVKLYETWYRLVLVMTVLKIISIKRLWFWRKLKYVKNYKKWISLLLRYERLYSAKNHLKIGFDLAFSGSQLGLHDDNLRDFLLRTFHLKNIAKVTNLWAANIQLYFRLLYFRLLTQHFCYVNTS